MLSSPFLRQFSLGRRIAQSSIGRTSYATYYTSGEIRSPTAVLIPGDGVGPELMDRMMNVLENAKVPINWEIHDKVSGEGCSEEVLQDAFDAIDKHRIAVKGPLNSDNWTKGDVSLNVLLRKHFGLFSQITPALSLPGMTLRHDNVDIVVIRENLQGEYSGIEHEVVPGVVESLKIITREHTRRIADYAFEYAYRHGRKKVTVIHKANIMKQGDGLFIEECKKAAERYPSIEHEEMIVDNTCMQLASKPEQFDVMLCPNLYGNIVGNASSGLVGGIGVVPVRNFSYHHEIWEPIHGDAPDIVGRDIANPTAVIRCATWMLREIKQVSHADRVERALNKTFEDGIMTADLGGKASSSEFTNAVIERLD